LRKKAQAESFDKHTLETFGLPLKNKSGSITPIEQGRLSAVQAEREALWAQRLARASRLGHNPASIQANVSGNRVAAPDQPSQARVQREVEIDGRTFSSKLDTATLLAEVAQHGQLTMPMISLLRDWVRSSGPTTVFGTRLRSGTEKKYEDYEELYRALKGEVEAQENLAKETALAREILEGGRVLGSLNTLAPKIYAFIEEQLGTPQSAIQGRGGGPGFWQEASIAYRGLWNVVGMPYNVYTFMSHTNRHLSRFLTFPYFIPIVAGPKSAIETFKDTLRESKGQSETNIFASIKQVSNIYSARIGKEKFQTPSIVNDGENLSRPRDAGFEATEEKRHNTQSLKEKEDWTLYARQERIPVSAGASGSMDRMYRLARDAGATNDELVALALAGHYVFNQVYTWISNDPHTFYEIMDTLHRYMPGKLSYDYENLMNNMRLWAKKKKTYSPK
jgi:hypothetical protein